MLRPHPTNRGRWLSGEGGGGGGEGGKGSDGVRWEGGAMVVWKEGVDWVGEMAKEEIGGGERV